MPVQNASSSHPLPVAMVIAVEPGLHLASPARVERPLTCLRGLLGSEAGLPEAVTQRRLGRGRQGSEHTETWHSCGEGSWAPGNALRVSKRGKKDGDREVEWPPGQEGGPQEIEGDKEKGKGLAWYHLFHTQNAQVTEGVR